MRRLNIKTIMRKIFLIFGICFFGLQSFAQKKHPHKRVSKNYSFDLNDSKYCSIGINPISFFESASNVSLCGAYRLSNRVGFWVEGSYIFSNFYMNYNWQNMKGFRFIFQPRYYMGEDRNYFIAPEFRIKQYSFTNRDLLYFTKSGTQDSLTISNFGEQQLLIGGAVVFGREYKIFKRKNIFLETTIGFGLKQRIVKLDANIPSDYKQSIGRKEWFYINYEENGGTFYIPLCARIIWKLK